MRIASCSARRGMVLGLSVVVWILDQWSKAWALTSLADGPWIITSWLHGELAFNRGAAFGWLSDHSGWQQYFFVTLAVGVTFFLLRWTWQSKLLSVWETLGLGLALGGIWGNAYDRVMWGCVIDFIELCWAHRPIFPNFNIADVGIDVGLACLVIHHARTWNEPSDPS